MMSTISVSEICFLYLLIYLVVHLEKVIDNNVSFLKRPYAFVFEINILNVYP